MILFGIGAETVNSAFDPVGFKGEGGYRLQPSICVSEGFGKSQ